MKLHFVCDNDKLYGEAMDLVRAFYPYIEEEPTALPLCLVAQQQTAYCVDISFDNRTWRYEQERNADDSTLLATRHFKWFVKRSLYSVLRLLADVDLPYGSLTGIRPTKLYYELCEEGLDAPSLLRDYFFVSSQKVRLVHTIIQQQKGIYAQDLGAFDHFANIPVCPTRCAYCSFIAETYCKVQKQIPDYCANLAQGIASFFELGVPRRAIYVGGGTPTSIPAMQLEQVLAAFRAQGEEFTVEAGRPETIDAQVVDVLRRCGVTRVSVNPQTFKQSTLSLIGRAHTVDDIYRAYDLVRDFDVNMDLIAMLPDESMEDFAQSLERCIALSPANITVHSLSIKRGSHLMLAGYDNAQNNALAREMSDYAFRTLMAAGYVPYYMYRQKNTQGRLENVGYTKVGKACVYNVDIMEETHSVHASGAGAISKRVFPSECRIERLSEMKEIKGFNSRAQEILQKKRAFFADEDRAK